MTDTAPLVSIARPSHHVPVRLDSAWVAKRIATRSCCVLATTSGDGPHTAAVLYVAVGTNMYVNTLRSSRKARNIARNPNVSVCIPIRRLPIGPPATVQFAAQATLLAPDDPEIAACLAAGVLKRITSHGEIALDGSCFVRITPTARINTYGLGMPLRRLIADPLHASGSTDVSPFPVPFPSLLLPGSTLTSMKLPA